MKTSDWDDVFSLLSREEAEQLEKVLRWIEDAMKENGREAEAPLEWRLERPDAHGPMNGEN
jgi:hypothetical protein